MKNNLVHVKVEHNEAIQAKKDLLSLEIELIRVIRTIKKYQQLRTKELRLKKRFKGTTGSTLTRIKIIEKNLPRIKLREIPHEDKQTKEEPKKQENKRRKNRDHLEKEIEQIQEKLRALEE
jgi:hypothetical protein